jgi:hypothetical protein
MTFGLLFQPLSIARLVIGWNELEPNKLFLIL